MGVASVLERLVKRLGLGDYLDAGGWTDDTRTDTAESSDETNTDLDPDPNSDDSTDDAEAPARTAAVLDPESAPTSRGEILEYGLSPAEYVRLVLEANDGWVPQRRFVETYGWSPSTIGRLLSDLEEEGVISRYERVRRKIVCLPAVELPSYERGQ
ncbi:helix-turn-helix transcriptional regulator [Natronobacterium lacisalsi]|uniref:helix-turn-helix transcriptional regulator n=1 Tax=Natronobacterium lacisalsi TaxID=229731 RepID=UPI001EE69955|nr:MarR family transcriptional regulator [Halobiforma lacisalsi]